MPNGPHRTVFDISNATIIKVIVAILAFLFIKSIADILVLLFVVLVVVAALDPIVDKWSKEMPRKLAVVLLYLIILLVIVATGLLITRPLVTQLQQLANNLPDYIKYINPTVKQIANESQKTLFSLSNELSQVGFNLLSTTLGVIGGVVAAVTVLVSSFYLLMEQQGAKKFFLSVVPSDHKEDLVDIITKLGDKMGAWLRGQLFLMVIVGVLDVIGLLILGMPYALALGIWAGLTEVIPFAGPVLGAIPAILIALSVSPLEAILVTALFVIVQQVEGNFLVPKIMGRAMGLSPVIIIFAMLIGAKLMGVLGIVLAVPAAGVVSVLVQEYPVIRQVLARH